MTLYNSLAELPASAKGHVIAIGNFDGVHLGHRAVIAAAKEMAVSKGLKLDILTFEPHPRSLFRPDDPPFRITPPALKAEKLLEAGADFIVSLPFDWDFASQSAENFVANILLEKLSPAHVLAGEDFQFGQLRKGTLDTIRAAGLAVTGIAITGDAASEKYSSTIIREALRAGEIQTANAMLGWDWEIRGDIVRGDRRGHELGYPTANVRLKDVLHPAYGIYASWVQIEGEDQWRMAATNIGIRPMFELKVGQVEAHILDFEDKDIYGQILRIRPVKRLRGEAKFDSLEALITQIDADCAATRRILSTDCG